MGTDRDVKDKRKKADFLLNLCCILLTILLFMGILFRMVLPFSEEMYLFGYRVGLVMSDSMEPAIPTYSLLIEKAYKEEDVLEKGDIISFYQTSDQLKERIRITHRIIDICDVGIQTKGDNNNLCDPYTVTHLDVCAKVVFIMPYFLPGVCILGTSVCIFFYGHKSFKNLNKKKQ